MKPYKFIYTCPMCGEDAFFLDDPLKGSDKLSIDISLVIHHIAWEDGKGCHSTKVKCQRCFGPIRHIDPSRVIRLHHAIMLELVKQ